MTTNRASAPNRRLTLRSSITGTWGVDIDAGPPADGESTVIPIDTKQVNIDHTVDAGEALAAESKSESVELVEEAEERVTSGVATLVASRKYDGKRYVDLMH